MSAAIFYILWYVSTNTPVALGVYGDIKTCELAAKTFSGLYMTLRCGPTNAVPWPTFILTQEKP